MFWHLMIGLIIGIPVGAVPTYLVTMRAVKDYEDIFGRRED